MDRTATMNSIISKKEKHQENLVFFDLDDLLESEKEHLEEFSKLLEEGDVFVLEKGELCIFLQLQEKLAFIGYSKKKGLFQEKLSEVVHVLTKKGEIPQVIRAMDFLSRGLLLEATQS